MIGMFYTRREQPFRYGLWFCGGAVATLFGGLASYGIGHLGGDLETWRYLYLIFGAVTAAWGALMLLLLPDNPSTTLWIPERQREAAVHRIIFDS